MQNGKVDFEQFPIFSVAHFLTLVKKWATEKSSKKEVGKPAAWPACRAINCPVKAFSDSKITVAR